MSLRPGKVGSGSSGSSGNSGSNTSGTSSSSKPGKAVAPRSSHAPFLSGRARLLLLALPVLLGWVVLLARRKAVKPLPPAFALCSPRNGTGIVTMDENNTRVQCLVVVEGKVAGTGTVAEVREQWGDLDTFGKVHKGRGVKVIYLKRGQTVLPGLIDAHAHILQNGEAASAVDLVGSTSIDDVVSRIASFIENDPELLADPSRYILGLGWDQTKWEGGAFPTADDLDYNPVLKGRPIYLKRIDVHALWVSNTILKQLGKVPDTVSGGLIVRLPSGEPSGVFLDNAMALVTAIIPPWTDEQRLLYLRTTARQMLDHGLTSVHDASLSLGDIAFLKKVDQEGRLPIRIYGMVSCDPLNSWCGDEVERYDGDRFVLRAIKIFTDGALGSWGAAMHEPYSDNPKERGIMISPPEEIAPLVAKWVQKGFQVCSHAIGDRANTVVIDAYEKALEGAESSDLRLRIEHAQIMTPEDILRAGRLGLISSVQPTHATSDMGYAEARLGPTRVLGAYAWSSLLAAGSPLALGSDFPVEGVNPFLGIYSAITRKWRNGDSPHGTDGWFPGERLSLEQTLRGFGTWAAFASFQEHRVGSLEVGKEADFIVIKGDLWEMDEFEVPETEVIATVVGGRLFHGRLE